MNRILLFQRKEPYCAPDFNASYQGKDGLCNQLMALVRGIIETKQILFVDSFLCCTFNGNITPVSKILDLTKTMAKLEPIKRTLIEDRVAQNGDRVAQCKIVEAKYGANETWIDVTRILQHRERYCADLVSNPNDVFGDPICGVMKSLVVKYSLSSTSDEILEKLNYPEHEIKIYFTGEPWRNLKGNFCWYNFYNVDFFYSIFNCITFNPVFYFLVDELLKETPKFHCIHYRFDADAIKHWSTQNKMSEDRFRTIISNKYTHLLEKYFIGDNLPIYILGNNTLTNEKIAPRVKWISAEKKQELTQKYLGINGNELNAIIDFIIGSYCTETFLGCHNIERMTGSTFSYFLFRNLEKKASKRILFDLDRINDEEVVIFNTL